MSIRALFHAVTAKPANAIIKAAEAIDEYAEAHAQEYELREQERAASRLRRAEAVAKELKEIDLESVKQAKEMADEINKILCGKRKK